jgi:hypothetical protein
MEWLTQFPDWLVWGVAGVAGAAAMAVIGNALALALDSDAR